MIGSTVEPRQERSPYEQAEVIRDVRVERVVRGHGEDVRLKHIARGSQASGPHAYSGWFVYIGLPR
jgi:hypothetical protein